VWQVFCETIVIVDKCVTMVMVAGRRHDDRLIIATIVLIIVII